LQSAVPIFSAECDAITEAALAVPALPVDSVVLPSAAYCRVGQSVSK
jgi:hypothetical protein